MDIIPGLQCNSLIIISKFAEANYLEVFMSEEVQVFDGDKATVASSRAPILEGGGNQ